MILQSLRNLFFGKVKSPTLLLLNEHLNDQVAGIPTTILHRLAEKTNDHYDFLDIMTRLWEIITVEEYLCQPRLLKKALIVLEHLLIHGNKRVLVNCKEGSHIQQLNTLSSNYNRMEVERYVFSNNIDIGAGVRKQAKRVHDFITIPKLLVEEQNQATALTKKLQSVGLRESHERYTDTRTNGWDFGGKDHTKHSNQQLY